MRGSPSGTACAEQRRQRESAGKRPPERTMIAARNAPAPTRRLVPVHLLLTALGALFMTPFAWLVITSFKPEAEVFQTVWPHHWVWENYTRGLAHFPFLLYF